MDNEESEGTPEELESAAIETGPEESGKETDKETDEETGKESDEPGYHHARNGNVARLPKVVRDKINWLILDGNTYKQVIEKLGEDGKGLKPEHIKTWKQGGYQDWLVELQRREGLQSMHEDAMDILQQKSGATIQDAGRTVAGAQLYDLLTSFDRNAFAAALVKKPELYLRIIGTLARLSEGEAACSHVRALESAMVTKPKPGQNDRKIISAETLKEILHQTKIL